MLRQFEIRVRALEADVAQRDAEIAELRREREADDPLGGAPISSARLS